MKKRSCRMTQQEREQHNTAVSIRKMTDEQLCAYIEDIMREGIKLGKSKAAEQSFARRSDIIREFIQRLSVKSSTGNGIGPATVQKIKAFAEKEGYLDAQ
jgi:hypothetical protein